MTMDSTAARNEERESNPSSPYPQLARKCYAHDGTTTSSDESSLEIISPIRGTTKRSAAFGKNAVTKQNPADIQKCQPLSIKRNQNLSSSSSSSEDDDNDDEFITLSSVRQKIDLPSLNEKPESHPTEQAHATVVPSKPVRTLYFSLPSSDDEEEDDDDDDDEDDNLVLHPNRALLSQKSTKVQGKKRQRPGPIQHAKQDKAEERQRAREVKEQQKMKERVVNIRQNQEHAQAMGKYRHDEVAVLFDPGCRSKDDEDRHWIIEKVDQDFLVHTYHCMLSSRSSTLDTDVAVVQFIRKDSLDGGAKDAISCLESNNTEGYEHLHNVIIVIEPDDFIPLLRRDNKEEDDDYPALESWLKAIQSRWRHEWGMPQAAAAPKILLLLRDLPNALDKKWVQHRRRDRKEPSLPRESELYDAVQWLLIQFQVECMFCPTVDVIQMTIHKMTRALCDKPYFNQVSELECIKKIKQGAVAKDDPMGLARDVWLRQLQQVPGLSEVKAQHVVEHYPTCQSLWRAYQQREDGGGKNKNHSALLATIFSGGIRCESKLSDSVFKIMTSNEPEEMIL